MGGPITQATCSVGHAIQPFRQGAARIPRERSSPPTLFYNSHAALMPDLIARTPSLPLPDYTFA